MLSNEYLGLFEFKPLGVISGILELGELGQRLCNVELWRGTHDQAIPG